MTALLELQGVCAAYGSVQVLFGVDLELEEGAVIGLMGRNGMGKTTTIRTICGMLRPSAGHILISGHERTGQRPHRLVRHGIGLVPEGRRVFGNLSVRENLVVAARGGQWQLADVYELFPALEGRARQMAATLSGGEQQMLAIGRALMTSPRLLLLDEATEGLAPMVRAQIWASVERLKKSGLSIVVVDKSLKEMSRVMDRAVILERGQSVWHGRPGEITAEVAQRYLGV